MKIQLLFLSAICLLNAAKVCGFTQLPSGARSLAMGGAYVALANTADAVFTNPAGLAQLDQSEATGFHQKPFGLQDVSYSTLALSVPLTSFRLGLGLTLLDNDIYREQGLRIGLAGCWKDKFCYGVGVEVDEIDIKSYGSGRSVNLTVGAIVPISTELSLGFVAGELHSGDMDEHHSHLPQTLAIGTTFAPYPDLILNMEIFKDVRFEQELRFGSEVEILPFLALRGGCATNPDRFSAGFGIKRNWLSLDYAFFTHNALGLTHQFAFTIRLGLKR